LAHSRPKHVEKRNKHTKKNYAPSWVYLQDNTEIHGQQNIKFCSGTSQTLPNPHFSGYVKVDIFQSIVILL
jgi:hypothetical protein